MARRCQKLNITNLFVAIAIPLRSRIKPINAYFTVSEWNVASDVDSKLTKTLGGINTRTKFNIIQEKEANQMHIDTLA